MSSAALATEPALRGVIDQATAAIAAASADCLQAVALYDERKWWERDGATSMSSWLSARYGLTWGTAREWVRVARALRHLPALAEAFSFGRLSWDQLRPLTKFATAETDEVWARRAPGVWPSTLWREARRHERAVVREANDVRRRRHLELWEDPEVPVMYLEGMLPSEEGAAVRTALEKRAEEIVLADSPPDPRGARMADALVELVTGGSADDGPRPTMVIHAEATALAGEESDRGPWLAETEDGVRLPSEAVRRLACDGRIEWVLERAGRVVGIGRRGRSVPEQLLRVLRERDEGTCRFPGCGRKRWLQAHHLRHWGRGGLTDLDNLVLLCHAHHRLIHEGGWSVQGHPSEELRFRDPGGRPLERARGRRTDVRVGAFP
jgi:hypothetical protein